MASSFQQSIPHLRVIIGLILYEGGSQNLVIVLSIYEPTVACFGRQFTMKVATQTLQNLLSQIPVSTERQTFGPEGEPGVQVVVPKTYSVPPTPSEYKNAFKPPTLPLP